jgi:tetratricopeptide (TPR) repeat protein
MMRPHRILIGSALATLVAGAALAQDPPSRDTIVETQLLPRGVKASVQRLALANAASISAPERLASAQRLIEAGRASGDPRTLGYAESLLAPWHADDSRAPLDALVLRATIEQSRHRFDAARMLLDRVIARAPDHGQALLTRATIAQVRGDYAAANADCARLRPLNADVAAICAALTDALTGANDRALAVLRVAAERTQGAVRAWALGALAQVHEQRGEPDEALRAYRASLAAGDDLSTRLALADLLIERRAWRDAQALLADAPAADGVLLRRWRVERALGGAAPPIAAQLRARIDEAIARGELLHAREAALFALEQGDVATALRLARESWAAQREPADLRVLARSARAINDRAALDEVRAWVKRTGLVDARLRAELQGA